MFNLGQTVYWVEQETGPVPIARVWVCAGQFFTARHSGEAVAIILPDRTTALLDRPVLFSDPADAVSLALGRAVRLLVNFKYQSVEVTDHNRKVFSLPGGLKSDGAS